MFARHSQQLPTGRDHAQRRRLSRKHGLQHVAHGIQHMLAIVQQDNKIHEPRAPQCGEWSATVTGQTECGHHYVGHRGRIRHRGQLDYPHPAAYDRAPGAG